MDIASHMADIVSVDDNRYTNMEGDMKHTVLRIFSLFLVAVFAFGCSVSSEVAGIDDQTASTDRAAGSTIKIASFNLKIFGPTKAANATALAKIASVVASYDIIALQEVGSNGTPSDSTATTVMNTLLAKVNSIAGSGAYSYVRGNQFAYVYKNSTIIKKASGLYSGSFKYPPLQGHFQASGKAFDFALVNVHTSPTIAKTEIPMIITAMSSTRTKYSEQDVIALGDFNADGSYYSPGASGGDLAGFSSSTYTTVIKNGTDTTVSANNSYTYDRMQFYTAATGQDFTGTKGVYKTGITDTISDHYPIYATFYTGNDTN